MRYLAIDLGARRTGFATGDDGTGIVSPAGMVEVGDDAERLDATLARITEHAPDVVVIGLPLNMDGTEGPPAAAARTFGESLAARTGAAVRYQDERLTSYDADQRMARSGRTHRRKKALRDALAACAILEDHLAAGGGGDVPGPSDGS